MHVGRGGIAASFWARPRPEHADVRRRRLQREPETLAIALEMVVH